MERNPSVAYLEQWLSEHGLEALKDHGIRVTNDPRYSGLYCLKYGPIADKSSRIVQVCRGAVVEDWFGTWQTVAYAFDRFFNPGEPWAAEIDWKSARVYEKYDGSLIKLFNHYGTWVVSTSGTVGADIRFGEMPMTFEQLFWQVFGKVGYSEDDLEPSLVYVFELCSSHNKVVVNHKFDTLPLLTVRDKATMAEMALESFSGAFQVAQPWTYLRSLDKILECASSLKGSEHEGFVIVDKHGSRLKVKGESYVRMHQVKGNGNPSFFELWKADDLDEFLTYFPEYREEFDMRVAQIGVIGYWVEDFVRLYRELDQKEFAMQVMEHHKPVSGAMFGIRAGKYSSFSEWLSEQTEKKYQEIAVL